MVFNGMTTRGHERVLFVNNPDAGLKAIIAIHDTTLGPGLGGIRRWHYKSEQDGLEDVLRLSEAMTYKNAGADLGLGGGKSVILLEEPGKPFTRDEALAMGEAVRSCCGDYIAAEDVGVNEEFVDTVGEITEFVTGGVKRAPGGDPGRWTAQGVVNGMKAALQHAGGSGDFDGVSVNIMGLGSVGMHIASILADTGAQLRGYDLSEARCEQAREESGVEIVDDAELFSRECDIFSPCALGGVLDAGSINRLNARIVCGAANNPLADPERDAALLASSGVIYAPDFIVNAGGVIRLGAAWYKWGDDVVLNRIAQIEETTLRILETANSRKMTTHAAALAYAKAKIEAGKLNGATTAARSSGQPAPLQSS